MSKNYTQEQIKSMGITKLKKLVRDEKLGIKGYSNFNKSTKDDLAEKVITKLMIKGEISSTEEEEKFDEEGQYIPPPQEEESREERINRILEKEEEKEEKEEKEEIQIDTSLDKYIPKREVATARVMDSSNLLEGVLEQIKSSIQIYQLKIYKNLKNLMIK